MRVNSRSRTVYSRMSEAICLCQGEFIFVGGPMMSRNGKSDLYRGAPARYSGIARRNLLCCLHPRHVSQMKTIRSFPLALFFVFFSVRVASARGDDLIFADLHNAASATPHERETSHYSAILGEVGPLSRSVTIHTYALMLMLLWKSVRDGFNADNKKQSKRVLLSRLKYTVRQGCDPSFYNVTNKYIPFFMRCY